MIAVGRNRRYSAAVQIVQSTVSPQAIFLSAFFIIALGYGMRASGLVDRSHGNALAKIVMNVTLPAVILETVPQVEFSASLVFLTVLALVHGAVAFFVVQLLFRKRSLPERGLFAILLMGFNNGLFAFPIVREIWGIEAIKLLALFDVGNGLVILGASYVVSVWFSSGGEMRLGATLRVVGRTLGTSVPLIVFTCALALNLLDLRLPSVIARAVSTVASANGFLGLAVLGIFQSLRVAREDIPMIAKLLGLRYLLGIAFGVASVMLFGRDAMMNRVLSIAYILPAAMLVIPYSEHFGFNTRLASTVVNLSIVVSFAVMWGIVTITG